MHSVLLGLHLLLSPLAVAGTHAGVTLPDSVSLSGSPLVLNGMGLREKYFIDIYVAGLYLPAKTSDAAKAINDDVPKQITMSMTYDLSKAKLADAMRDGMSSAPTASAKAHTETLAGWMEDVGPGDKIVITYLPGKGTSVSVKGKEKGTIAGVDFMKAIWTIYLGSKPPTSELKKGLLGK